MSTLVLTQILHILPFPTHPMKAGIVGSGGVGTPLLLSRSFRGQSKVPVGAQEESVGLGGGAGRTLEPNGDGLQVEVCERTAVGL